MPTSITPQAKSIPEDIFSRRLVIAMGAAGLTQQELSARAGCSQPDISRYLKGRVPSGEKLVALARALGTTAESLLGFDPLPKSEDAHEWRRKADIAQGKVEMLKSGLQGLLKKI
jgi:transcriptional regulator with XRE-family HTH domain